MEHNRDWKGIAALVLAGLALFVALGGRISFPDQGPSNQVVFVGGSSQAQDPGGQQVAPNSQAFPNAIPPVPQQAVPQPQQPQAPNIQQAPSGPGPFRSFHSFPGAG